MEVHLSDGGTTNQCVYTPHSLRATTATLLLDASVDIRKVQDLLGHRHIINLAAIGWLTLGDTFLEESDRFQRRLGISQLTESALDIVVMESG